MSPDIAEIREDDSHSRKFKQVFKTLIVVATDIERDSVLELLEALPTDETPLKLHIRELTYYLGVIGEYPVIVVKMAMMGSVGRDASLPTVSAALTYWGEVKAVIMIGIAFGIDPVKQSIGDLLVSSGIYTYEMAKIDGASGVQPRGNGTMLCSATLRDRFGSNNKWTNPISNIEYAVRVGPILSGEKLINDQQFKSAILFNCPNAIGGEMEGAGLLAACGRKSVDWLICKAICDWADGSKNDAWQVLAATNAAHFLKSVLSGPTALESLGVQGIDTLFGTHTNYHNVHGREIIDIIHPKHDVREYPIVTIARQKIYYEFFTVSITNNITIGYLFFAKNINQDAAIAHFLRHQPQDYSSLTICTPRVQSAASGRDDFRVRNLKAKFAASSAASAMPNIEFYYLEDFVWKKCFERDIPAATLHVPDERYFIDQEIVPDDGGQTGAPKKSLAFFSEMLRCSRETKPIVVVLGGAGVGKTTLCDQVVRLISRMPQKRTIYISSTEVEPVAGKQVRTIAELYALSEGEREGSGTGHIEEKMLAVNISCGNLIVVIDGIDEIESKLKDDFVFEEFIQDAVDLNQSFNNCTVIVTCRDYYREKYRGIGCVEVLSLRGFDETLARDYFKKRCPKETDSAQKYLDSVKASFDGYYPPVVLSMICDIVEANGSGAPSQFVLMPYKSKYLNADGKNAPLDILLIKTLEREIKRQSLELTVDEIIDIFVEIATKDKERIEKKELEELVTAAGCSRGAGDSAFFLNPLLRTAPSESYVGFRYDNLGLLIKARAFCYNAQNGFKEKTLTEQILSQFYDGKGELLVEIHRHQPTDFARVCSSVSSLLDGLRQHLASLDDPRETRKAEGYKRQISAALYFLLGCRPGENRPLRTKLIAEVFKTEREVDRLFIYGDFYSLDFTQIIVKNSGFYQYTKFSECAFPKDSAEPIFFNTEFRDIDLAPGTLAQKHHFQACRMDGRMREIVEKVDGDNQQTIDKIKDDFRILFGVLYRNRMFVKKSEHIFKFRRRGLCYGIKLEDYLEHFVEKNVFSKERTIGAGSDIHYSISPSFRDEVRYFMDNNALRHGLSEVFVSFLREYVGIHSKIV